MSGSLLALVDLVESLEAQLKPYDEASRDITREALRCVRAELRSMRAMLASKSRYDPNRFALERGIKRCEAEIKWNRSILRQSVA